MGDVYSDPKFGVEQQMVSDRSGALNGTAAVAEIFRYRFPNATALTRARIRCAVGGTEAAKRQIVIGSSLAGTGATAQLGTQALGTVANDRVVDFAVTGNLAAGDDLVISQGGTGAAVYDIEVQVFYKERFVEA